jgi:hypothetical protein
MRPEEKSLSQDFCIERLRREVQAAKAAFEAAKRDHEAAIQRMKELGMTHPDGSVRHATRVYTFTLERYRKALWEYNRFILDR